MGNGKAMGLSGVAEEEMEHGGDGGVAVLRRRLGDGGIAKVNGDVLVIGARSGGGSSGDGGGGDGGWTLTRLNCMVVECTRLSVKTKS